MTLPEKQEAASSLCWNCHAELDSPYQCDRCVKIQPWPDGTDRFTFLGLPRRLRIDPDDLEERFLKLSRVFHPDFFQDSQAAERDISLVNAARLNKAYNTLKDPTSRASYILELELGSKYKPTKAVPPELAAEIMELQELLAEYTAHDIDDRAQEQKKSELEKRFATAQQRYDKTLEDLDQVFAEYDRMMDKATSPFEPEVRKKKEEILVRLDHILATRLYLKRVVDNIAGALRGNNVNPL
jgi:molecular chaperone HscB